MRRVITFRELGLCAMLTFVTLATAQPIITGLSTPDSLDHFELGQAGADDYGALPYGQGHVLFLSNRNENGLTARDPKTNEPFARPYLLRLKDLKTLPFELPGILADQKYHIGLCALLPDSSGIIASHSRSKPYKNGTVGLTLSFIPFNGEKAKELPFVDENADYQHPYFDPDEYTLYFATNVEGGQGGYDLYSSTLSFDGTWSAPTPVAVINSKADEVFPSLGPNLTLFFSRSTKNYGLQSFMHTAGDSSEVELPFNGRGDDFGFVMLNDSTAILSQSKRPGTAANLHLYKVQEPVALDSVIEESTDSAALAIAKADSIAAYEASQKNQESSNDSQTWTTDNSLESGTTTGYSLIVGGFVDRNLADNFLASISGWAPNAFLSRYNNKYYVVHSVHQTRSTAIRSKESVNNRGHRAWVLGKGLKEM